MCPALCLDPFIHYAGQSQWTESLFFCLKSKKNGAIWSSYFTGFTAIINIIINLWLLVSLHKLLNYFVWNEKWNFIPPGILPILYIELLFNILLFFLSFVLMIGVNRGFQGKKHIFTWIWTFAAFRCYETFIGVYVLVWLGSIRIPDIVYMFPEIIFIVFYWSLDTVIMIWCMITASRYYKEAYLEMYGKEKRVRYFKMLSNIRSAALSKSQTLYSGMATPRSMLMSRSTLGPGHSFATMSQASYPVGPRSVQPSASSTLQRDMPSQYHPSSSAPPMQPQMMGGPPPQQMPKGFRPSQSSYQAPMRPAGYAPVPQHQMPPPQGPPRQPYIPPASAGVHRPQPHYPGATPSYPGN